MGYGGGGFIIGVRKGGVVRDNEQVWEDYRMP